VGRLLRLGRATREVEPPDDLLGRGQVPQRLGLEQMVGHHGLGDGRIAIGRDPLQLDGQHVAGRCAVHKKGPCQRVGAHVGGGDIVGVVTTAIQRGGNDAVAIADMGHRRVAAKAVVIAGRLGPALHGHAPVCCVATVLALAGPAQDGDIGHACLI